MVCVFEILIVVLFAWIFCGAIKLLFKATWGLAKILATILFVIALPALIGCLMVASGIILLLPLGLIALAFIILKACT